MRDFVIFTGISKTLPYTRRNVSRSRVWEHFKIRLENTKKLPCADWEKGGREFKLVVDPIVDDVPASPGNRRYANRDDNFIEFFMKTFRNPAARDTQSYDFRGFRSFPVARVPTGGI